MLVSIVTPSLNQGQFIDQTLASVAAQDYASIEHLVVDGGSTDGTLDTLRKYEAHLAHWLSEPDRGQSHAINKGFARATGRVFAWLNSDDLLLPSAVRIAVDYLERYPEVGLVYGDRVHIDAKGNVVGVNRCPRHDPHMFRNDVTLPQETCFFRREVLEAVGGHDEDLHFAMGLPDLWIRIGRLSTMRHIPMFLGVFRDHGLAKSVCSPQQHRGDRAV